MGERAAALTVAIALTSSLTFISARGIPGVFHAIEDGDTQHESTPELLRYVVVPADDTRVAASQTPGFTRNPGRRSAASLPAAPAPAVDVPALANPVGRRTDPSRDVDPYLRWMPAPGRSYGRRPVTAPQLGHFPGTGTFTAEQMDSVLWKLERSVPRAALVPPSPAERDAMLRDEARRMADARDQHRPAPVSPVWQWFMPGADKRTLDQAGSGSASGSGFRLPLFSPGPSTAQRRRDSSIHAGNLLRLQHLAERAAARQDSLRRMDSIAMLIRPQ